MQISNAIFLWIIVCFSIALMTSCTPKINQNHTPDSMGLTSGYQETDNTKTCHLILEYRKTGGMDLYDDGDKIGKLLYIYKSGKACLQDLIYRNSTGKVEIEEVLAADCTLSLETLRSLHSIFRDNDFLNWPAFLPSTSPHEIQIRTPAPSVRIVYCVSDEIKVVNILQGADHKHYPVGFFRIHDFIMEIIEQVYADCKK